MKTGKSVNVRSTIFFDEPLASKRKEKIVDKDILDDYAFNAEDKQFLRAIKVNYQDWLKKNEERIREEEILATQSNEKSGDGVGNDEVVRKNNVFSCDLSQEEEDLIQRRVEENRRKLQAAMQRTRNRKIRNIQRKFPKVSDEEAEYALVECDHDEELAASLLMNFTYIIEIRKAIAMSLPALEGCACPGFEYPESDDERLLIMHNGVQKKRKNRTPKSPKSPNSPRSGSGYIRKGKRTVPKLLLDDAVQQGPSEKWSEARIKAYSQIDENPNAYYYRFNPPGQRQAHGGWTAEEEKLFFKRMRELGVDGSWGMFSMVIPGRVGYQCSNFYRKLIESKRIVDDNYWVDDNRKAHYIGKNGRKAAKINLPRAVQERMAEKNEAPSTRARPYAKYKKKQAKLKVDEDVTYRSSAKDDSGSRGRKRRKVERPSKEEEATAENSNSAAGADDMAEDISIAIPCELDEESSSGSDSDPTNPLKGEMDRFTLEPIKKPAISPYGHVLGMATWIRCLNFSEPKNTCPFSKKILQKRNLVRLTWENIDEYRDKMIL